VVVLQFHLEPTSRVEAVWWVDSPDLPSLYAEAPRLVDCQRLVLKMLAALDVRACEVRSVLAGPAGRLGPPQEQDPQASVADSRDARSSARRHRGRAAVSS
jgi:hypothetical protein